MRGKIKVSHILWAGGIGGSEEYVTSLSRFFNAEKFETHICFLSEKGVIFKEAKKIENVTIDFIGMRSGYDLIGLIKFGRYLIREKFDIIHSHNANLLSTVAFLLCKGSKKIFTEHVGAGAKEIFNRRKTFYKLFSFIFKSIITVSDFVKRKLTENMHLDPKKMIVISNGVQIDKYIKVNQPPKDLVNIKDRNKIVIGYIGRMEYYKRPGLFIEVAAELIRQKDDFTFIMVGDGSDLEKCKRMVRDFKISKHFIFTGFRRDIPEILTLFDAFLFTSDNESFGIVLLEAMAMGVPVFAVNNGAVPEIIIHKKSGILLKTSEAGPIADQMVEVIKDKEMMRSISNEGKKEVSSNYSIEKCARRMEEVYEKVLS